MNTGFGPISPATFAATAYFGPTYAVIQRLASDANRALAVALFTLPSGLIGLGLGPVFVGTLSDMFSAGIEANEGAGLQRALAITALVYFWASFHFWRAQASLTKRASLTNRMEPS
jgi:peptidoglycan biosynthesis protein MviN/MurJ (putative lipid II flippase)